MDKIIFHKAEKILDYDGTILNPAVVDIIKVNSIVRISMIVNPDYDKYDVDCFTHDAPYIKILEISNDDILGEVLDENRGDAENCYPVRTGERIWFKKNNIIEIPAAKQSKTVNTAVKKMRTDDKVSITGPLYTIIEEPRHKDEYDSDVSD